MSTPLETFRGVAVRFDEFLAVPDAQHGLNSVLRPGLGEESPKDNLMPRLQRTAERLRLFVMFGEELSDGTLDAVTDGARNMLNTLNQFARMSNQDYIQNKPLLLNGVKDAENAIKAQTHHAVAAAVLRSGLLQGDFTKRIAEQDQKLTQFLNGAASKLQEFSDERQRELSQYFNDREEKLKRSALKVSVEAAQEQFREATAENTEHVRVWFLAALLAIVSFAWFGQLLLFRSVPPQGLTIVYFTAVRVVLLSALGAVAAFCLRVLRAHMHMRAHNAHRLRVANSISAFVEAARTNEQSDIILAQLVSAVVTFGPSGLVGGDESSPVPVEALTKVMIDKS